MNKALDITKLEHTMDETSYQLDILAREEANDKEMIPRLQQQIISLSESKESLIQENYELKFQVLMLTE